MDSPLTSTRPVFDVTPDKERDSAVASAQETPDSSLYVVGIGASAGGFEALEQFFNAMPADGDMAFVVVQHLSPDHKSLMAELLSKHTPMPVVQATDGQRIEKNRIYLIPPRKNMTVFHGRLHLADKAPKNTLNFPIDIFLHSLAEDCGERAIAIILSGTGSDGTRGIRTVKEQGGMIMVQDLNSAKFDGMPSNAIATGLADYILDPGHMPEELLKFIKHPYVAASRRGDQKSFKDENHLERVFALLKAQTGIDFSWYKENTVSRRIERRLSVNQIEKLSDYVNYLYQNPGEVKVLYKELLIGVTRFFRDAEAFAVLKERVIPDIFANKRAGMPVRVWVTGCSTGEEAYSLAMLFREHIEEHRLDNEVKIFATDVDEAALEFASAGQYPESVAADMTSRYFKHFFIPKGDRHQIANTIREMVIFAQHNIVKDPPFNKIDLISCRNMLIYLQPEVQKKVMLHFNFGLAEDGFLFLGASESVGNFTNLFTPYDPKWKIFRCKGRHIPLHMEQFSISPVSHRRKKPETVFERFIPPQVDQRKVVAGIYERLFSHYVPPCAVINARHDLLHVLGDVSPYLKFQPGAISLKVTQLIRKELAIVLETGINKALRKDKEIVYRNIRLKDGDEARCLDLRLIPSESQENQEEQIFVLFEPCNLPANEDVLEEPHHVSLDDLQRVKDIEHELQYTRENLQATIEELETTNEELQATNEELLSANEELQSSNEELQSVNEELITVNSEYQSKIQELTELNNDVNNLLLATSIGTIFLDMDLRIRKFTPSITRSMNLLDTDIGRPINHITFTLDYGAILEDCRQVLQTLQPVEREARDAQGDWTLLRIQPYRTEEHAIKGLVISCIDITTLKRANAELYKLTLAVELSPSIVAITGPDGDVQYVNKSFCEATGYLASELRGRDIRLLRPQGEDDFESLWTRALAGERVSGVFSCRRKDGGVFWEQMDLAPIHDDQGVLLSVLKVSKDITETRRVQEELAASRVRMLRMLERLADGYLELDSLCHVCFASDGFQANLLQRLGGGGAAPALIGQPVWKLFPSSMEDALFKAFRKAAAEGEDAVVQLADEAAGLRLEFTISAATFVTAPNRDGLAVCIRELP